MTNVVREHHQTSSEGSSHVNIPLQPLESEESSLQQEAQEEGSVEHSQVVEEPKKNGGFLTDRQRHVLIGLGGTALVFLMTYLLLTLLKLIKG